MRRRFHFEGVSRSLATESLSVKFVVDIRGFGDSVGVEQNDVLAGELRGFLLEWRHFCDHVVGEYPEHHPTFFQRFTTSIAPNDHWVVVAGVDGGHLIGFGL